MMDNWLSPLLQDCNVSSHLANARMNVAYLSQLLMGETATAMLIGKGCPPPHFFSSIGTLLWLGM